MNTGRENQSQEIPTIREKLAKEARDLLLYAAQEGNAEDMQAYYYSLDIEKLLAFIETEGEGLSRLPAVIADVLLRDSRKEIQDALKANSAIFKNPHFFAVRNLEKVYGLTPEEVVENGRKCVANILYRVTEVGRELRGEEVNGVKNMARNIPDPNVIEAILPLAEKNVDIASELMLNPAITAEHINKIINFSLKEMENNDRWENILLEIIAYRYNDLDELMKRKLNSTPSIKMYMEIFNRGRKAEMSNGKGKKRQTPGQRKVARTEKKERRQALFDDESFGQATA